MDATYTVEMRDDGSSEIETFAAADDDAAIEQAEELTRDWVQGGDWGEEGAAIDAGWTLYRGDDTDGEAVDNGHVTVEIEPNHEELMRRAGAPDDCEHDWTSEGEGGCSENPGVWSTGGTSMVFRSHCRHCGLVKVEHTTGSQRNPGEHDTVSYEMPEPIEAD